MPSKFRLASFNVQNLFGRSKVFNFKNHSDGDQILGKIDDFRKLINQDNYSAQDKQDIVDLYVQIKDYIIVREDRGKLFKKLYR